jgi:hypothetical protein
MKETEGEGREEEVRRWKERTGVILFMVCPPNSETLATPLILFLSVNI